MSDYTHIVDLAEEVNPPDDGILTRTLPSLISLASFWDRRRIIVLHSKQ